MWPGSAEIGSAMLERQTTTMKTEKEPR